MPSLTKSEPVEAELMPHRIHLKGPWTYHWTDGSPPGGFPNSGSVTMPRDWRAIFGDSRGTASFHRKFHRPTNLESHERVMLVLTEVRGKMSIQLNERQIGLLTANGERIELEITSQMNPFNELIIIIEFDPMADSQLLGGLYGAVALDIHSDESHRNK